MKPDFNIITDIQNKFYSLYSNKFYLLWEGTYFTKFMIGAYMDKGVPQEVLFAAQLHTSLRTVNNVLWAKIMDSKMHSALITINFFKLLTFWNNDLCLAVFSIPNSKHFSDIFTFLNTIKMENNGVELFLATAH